MINLNINGQPTSVDAEADTPLLWVLRDTVKLTGTKFGCGVGACGACTVHVDGEAVRSCSYTLEEAAGKDITTIEGIGQEKQSAVQMAWLQEQVPQCGYCQSGMIMAVSALLEENPNPTDEDIDASITNICRCGTYPRIRKAIHEAVKIQTGA
ncbi:2Fe-2S iron-sulfur cluster binding domain-containing protein [Sneathiella sp. P13V-1]|uniref:(2Fe-2S)-binding protein n=1 Tax=Sneathiella sp. P13V-1 TaxID=2697366 RepID=UPI00187B7FB8|nr:(2Fe-2S)-binding protein [Sneathiella sp. P13V-1]MBE7637308.1 2Fe-2S iron-sulfur cluster binding domain-containing protein [Sneathiella sp. P13V-1]